MGSYGTRDENYKNSWFLFVIGIALNFIFTFGYNFANSEFGFSLSDITFEILRHAIGIIPSALGVMFGIMSIKNKEDVHIALIITFLVLNIFYIIVGRFLVEYGTELFYTKLGELMHWTVNTKHVHGGGYNKTETGN